MSRTDKDTPWHVTARQWTAWHDRCQHAPTRYPNRACNLPEQPDPKRDTGGYPRTGCGWIPEWERHHYPNPPHWYINHVWSARERLAARVDCINAAKQWRAGGDVDVTPTIRQNRHCAQWLWS